jgi:hypothetical protein
LDFQGVLFAIAAFTRPSPSPVDEFCPAMNRAFTATGVSAAAIVATAGIKQHIMQVNAVDNDVQTHERH